MIGPLRRNWTKFLKYHSIFHTLLALW